MDVMEPDALDAFYDKMRKPKERSERDGQNGRPAGKRALPEPGEVRKSRWVIEVNDCNGEWTAVIDPPQLLKHLVYNELGQLWLTGIVPGVRIKNVGTGMALTGSDVRAMIKDLEGYAADWDHWRS